MRVQLPGTSANFSVSADAVITWRTWPRSMRSARSRGPSSVVAGMTTAPSLMQASITSQSGIDVAEHEQHPVAAVDAFLLQPGGQLGRARGQLGVGQLVLVAVGVARSTAAAYVGLLGGEHVEPVEAEVEVLERPASGTRPRADS